jgi:hypothetical protein
MFAYTERLVYRLLVEWDKYAERLVYRVCWVWGGESIAVGRPQSNATHIVHYRYTYII